MRYAIINAGIVTNVVLADPAFAADQGWVATDDAGPGWTYADGVFTPPPVPEPDHEALLTALRAERTARLTACDWTQLPDAPLTSEQRTAWAAYRQALRDLPETYAHDPAAVVWPALPGA